jgi:TonB family protein
MCLLYAAVRRRDTVQIDGGEALMPVLIFALAAALGAPPEAAPATPHTVSPVQVTAPPKAGPVAASVDVIGEEGPGSGDFVAIWPDAAYQMGVDGHVTLSCRVDVHGLAERCQVASERPKGRGLGRAALQLRATFLLQPAKGPDGQPIDAVMSINVAFKPPKKDLVGTEASNAQIGLGDAEGIRAANQSATGAPLAMRAVTMLDDPVWVAAASFEDLAKAYPAKGGGVAGYVAAHCRVLSSGDEMGALRDCEAIKESPAGLGFGKAALGLAARFRVAPDVIARAPNHTPVWVDIPIRLPPPDAAAERTVMAPTWILGIDPRATPKVFPPEAVASGLTSGRGVARCTVGADGTMADCVPEAGEPDGLGFSEAAAKLATGMRMNLWSADGAPVEGGVVHIPIRLNLKGGAS